MTHHATIHTRHHHLMELIDADEVYFTAPKGERAQHYTTGGPASLDELRKYVKELDTVPRFVISSELMTMTHSDEYHKSLLDMKRAGVCKLPYQMVVVEVRYPGSSAMVALWQPENPEVIEKADVLGHIIRVHEDADGRYLVVAPSVAGIKLQEKDGAPWVHFTAQAYSLLPVPDDIVGDTYSKDCSQVALAWFAIMLLMATEGVEKQVIECERLNKRRALANKQPIPRHTYLYIGRVYRSAKGDASDAYDPRRSPRPHWRRGHVRRVRIGTGRMQTKLVYINPRLVAYHGDALIQPEPTVPDYVVAK